MRLLLLILAVLYGDLCHSQSNEVSGEILFPQIKKKMGISRGTQYRNRLSQVKLEENVAEGILPHQQVVVSAQPLSFRAKSEPMVADMIQRNKSFKPNVLAVTKGSTVRFINNDDFYHNVFSLSPKARFNIGRRKPGKVISKRIDKKGVIKVFCDIHPQMNAIILSLETPYFTKVDESGSYQLDGLPDGRYMIHVFHPSLSFPSKEVTVSNGMKLEKNFMSSIYYIEQQEPILLSFNSSNCCNSTDGINQVSCED